MQKSISWRMYRDDGKESLPKKVARLIPIYKEKTGRVPTAIGLPISMMGYELIDELRKRFIVEFAVPAWAGSEIWFGEVKTAETQSAQRSDLEMSNASI